MAEQRVGTCSLCGGSVVGYRGAWHGILPPPPDKCSQCGAVAASDVIPMVHPGFNAFPGFRLDDSTKRGMP